MASQSSAAKKMANDQHREVIAKGLLHEMQLRNQFSETTPEEFLHSLCPHSSSSSTTSDALLSADSPIRSAEIADPAEQFLAQFPPLIAFVARRMNILNEESLAAFRARARRPEPPAPA